ncbi:hypothetical protein P4O66_022336 [Electrophorus voltai]|uniref:Nucleolar protein 4 helical domain-containing protein n=1 Tax=Electrophorus voltai TaxID=2609070 RepID=A0AAD9DZS8_9TELE|nr:hypothetical protein P4O66_022336 [Electrophorus voltai]
MSTKKQNVDLSKRSTELSEGETFGEFQDWCLRTYGDSGKTKTVTRRKYNKILQTLLQSEDADAYMDSNHINAKFKFWVKSKGFQVGNCNGQQDKNGTSDRPVLYVPIKAAVSTTRRSASQLVSASTVCTCGDCALFCALPPESERPASLVPALIDYNMPLTTTYLKQMKLRCLTNGDQDESSVSSEEFDMSDPTWISAEHHSAQSDLNPPISTERMHSPQNTHKEEDVGYETESFVLGEGADRQSWQTNLGLERKGNICDYERCPQDREGGVAARPFQGHGPGGSVTNQNVPLYQEKNPAAGQSEAKEDKDDRITQESAPPVPIPNPLRLPPALYAAQRSPPSPSLGGAALLAPCQAAGLRFTRTEEDRCLCRLRRLYHTPPQPPAYDSSSESGSGNGAHSMTPPSMGVVAISDSAGTGPGTGPYSQVNGNGTGVPLDFSTTSSSSSEERQPMHLRERQGQAPPTASTMLGTFNPEHSEELRRKYPRAPLASELRLERDIREYANKSPQYGAGTYDSIKMEMCAEDLTVSRSQAADDDDDDHDDHDDSDKINDTEGVDPERLKAFNMFVRLFVDENLDRMVPISKQPKEKIQAIIESCSRQFPEFQERARKRIRTYLKSCRRMKKNGMETRPTPPHLTSAMAENILAAACESETRNAAKRMRMDVYQTHEDQIALDKAASREPVPLPPSAYPLAASAYSQDQLYINGGLSYTYRAYSGLGGGVQHPIPLTTTTAQSNGPTDLSMKSLTSNSSTSSTSSLGRSGGGGGGGASAQLSHTEVAAVRQLIAGYRESAAFLLRSADELENLILQQN